MIAVIAAYAAFLILSIMVISLGALADALSVAGTSALLELHYMKFIDHRFTYVIIATADKLIAILIRLDTVPVSSQKRHQMHKSKLKSKSSFILDII